MKKYYVFIIIVIVFLLGRAFLIIFNQNKNTQNNSFVTWKFDRNTNKWESSGTPPKCPALIFETPINLSKVTSILYPGQYRGGNYKPHGGFRYDNPKINNLKVISPIAGYVLDGNRRIVSNEAVEYNFDIINPCGIMIRLDHLTNLSPKFKKLAGQLPEPIKGDSRTTTLTPYVLVKKGEWIGTQIKTDLNFGLDWGVYDLRKENEASKNPIYREKHQKYARLNFYALCWLNYLSPKKQIITKSLPAGDETAGRKSDYCLKNVD